MEHDLLAELHRLGIKLRLIDGRLDVVAPTGTLTPALREQLKGRRDELIAMLQSDPRGDGYQLRPRPGERHDPFPLTDIQHAYWIGHNRAFELGGVATHFYFELEREGLDVTRLECSLRKVIRRHDMLRVVIEPDGRQHVLAEVPDYRIAFWDHPEASEVEHDKHLTDVRAQMGHQVRRPDQWPLFEVRATRRKDALRLHVSLDLLILDAFSIDLFFRDWQRFYEEEALLPQPTAVTYRDHVLAEEAARDGAEYRAAEAYWHERLDSLPPAPELPLAKQPSQLERTEFTRRRARLPRDRWNAIKQTARKHGVTPSVVLMTAFTDVLRLWSKQPDFTLNLTLFNRPADPPEIAEVIGDFTSLTLLEAGASHESTFARRALELQNRLMQDLQHLSYSGVRVLRERARRLGDGPGAAMPIVFTSALGFAAEADTMNGMSFFGDYRYGISQTPQVWLDHQVLEEHGELVYNWDAVEALFPAGLLDDMLGSYRDVLDRLSISSTEWADDASQVELPLCQHEERQAANRTQTPLPGGTLSGIVADQAARRPDAPAVIFEETEYTYAQVTGRAHQMARRIRTSGVETGQLVAVVLEKGVDQVCAVLGVTASGAAYLPIDPQWPQARLHQLLESGQVRVVITSPRLREELIWPSSTEVLTFEDAEVKAEDPRPLPDGPAPEDLAYVIFTSGSTGRPKGVMIDHRGAVNTVQDINRRFSIGPADRILALSALTFDLSVYDVFGTLAAGATLVMPSPARAQEPTNWTELVRRHGVTVWNSVPALMQLWVESASLVEPGGISPLRLVLLSGDWVPVRLPDAVRMRHPHASVISLGGATEASIWSVCYPIGEVPLDWTRIPYGKPLANQTLHVYHPDFSECPVWTIGEIYIGGIGVAKGYWADAERTAERFLRHPETGEVLYRTGDLGRYLPGGDIEFLGREDHQVKLNGYRIELDEIAAALERQPGVHKALVRVDTNPGSGRRQLVAYTVTAQGAPGAAESFARESALWPTALEAGEKALRDGLADLKRDLDYYRCVWRQMEETCVPVMARTFAQLGVFTTADDSADAAEIVERSGSKPEYRGLIQHWLDMLVEHGVLDFAEQTGRYRATSALEPGVLERRVRDLASAIEATGPARVFADYLLSCAEHQVDLLRGRVSPLELLMPGGGSQVTDMLYAQNPVSALQNRITAGIVAARASADTDEGPLRILEIGAGTGATTSEVLRQLPSRHVQYRFTDVSTYFTARARQKFAEHGCIDYGVCDIDEDFTEQGQRPGSADIVLAANVLHDAKNLDTTLGHIQRVLAPGGALIAIEGTENSLIQMVTVGFIEGFSHHEGRRDLPLLSTQEWRQILEKAGFERSTTVPRSGAATDMMVQHVLVAETGSGTSSTSLDAAALRAGVESLLPDYMVPHHYLTISQVPLSANGKVDVSALPTPWQETQEARRVAPRDDVETTLLSIWQDILGTEDFGVEDNFFEVGGDSLHAVHILARIRDTLPVHERDAEDGLQILFENPTVAALAQALSVRNGA
ncbi:non-ribosomal peptide synthetase [Streptomyces soliscabiei]|uniref:non-ribosomal peptide synthetase n=1 Tax=Streptomyces soliscabiei TaxID=588897 RepID=UPI0029BF2E4E|nr:non-ribosomal peptide synthetase [Streptomyces sp. NY05-11A]MDX2679230.1 amino acid adenylation domain-containing protein [Streptomyces sp. NY05-11A]